VLLVKIFIMSMRQTGTAMRSTSGGFQSAAASGQSPLLLARINEKKAELESLRELRDLSAQMAGQMEMLEEKLATLAGGTEGICCIQYQDIVILILVQLLLLSYQIGTTYFEPSVWHQVGDHPSCPMQ